MIVMVSYAGTCSFLFFHFFKLLVVTVLFWKFVNVCLFSLDRGLMHIISSEAIDKTELAVAANISVVKDTLSRKQDICQNYIFPVPAWESFVVEIKLECCLYLTRSGKAAICNISGSGVKKTDVERRLRTVQRSCVAGRGTERLCRLSLARAARCGLLLGTRLLPGSGCRICARLVSEPVDRRGTRLQGREVRRWGPSGGGGRRGRSVSAPRWWCNETRHRQTVQLTDRPTAGPERLDRSDWTDRSPSDAGRGGAPSLQVEERRTGAYGRHQSCRHPVETLAGDPLVQIFRGDDVCLCARF